MRRHRTWRISESFSSMRTWVQGGWRLESLGSLAEASQRVAIDLARDVEVGDSEVLASELCQLFYSGWGLPFGQLTVDDLNVLLSKLESVQDIDDFHINAFLVKASGQDAKAVVALLLTRIKKKGNEGTSYRALPILGFRDRLIGFGYEPRPREYPTRDTGHLSGARGGLSSTGYRNCSERSRQASSRLRV